MILWNKLTYTTVGERCFEGQYECKCHDKNCKWVWVIYPIVLQTCIHIRIIAEVNNVVESGRYYSRNKRLESSGTMKTKDDTQSICTATI